MDAKAKKALFRSKLNAQKREKRIDSPLVRYNELDQSICRVCEVIVKSESSWPAHQASRKHLEAINKLKASAVTNTVSKTVPSGPSKELPKRKSEVLAEKHDPSPEPSKETSGLPSDFFDNRDNKRQKAEGSDRRINDITADESSKNDRSKENGHSSKVTVHPESKQLKGVLPQDFFDDKDGNLSQLTNVSESNKVEGSLPEGFFVNKDDHSSNMTAGAESTQAKGFLPEGFFDNKDADLRARGITPIKPDIKDEYKDYEKSIQEDLQAIDNRLEEEEYDAADMIEEAESVEQRTYREKVERLRKMKMELKAVKASFVKKSVEVSRKQPTRDDNNGSSSSSSSSSSDDDDDSDENSTVDWRAKHL